MERRGQRLGPVAAVDEAARSIGFSYTKGECGPVYATAGTDGASTDFVVESVAADVGAVSFDVHQVLDSERAVLGLTACGSTRITRAPMRPATRVRGAPTPGTACRDFLCASATVSRMDAVVSSIGSNIGSTAVAADCALGWGRGAVLTEIGFVGYASSGAVKAIVDHWNAATLATTEAATTTTTPLAPPHDPGTPGSSTRSTSMVVVRWRPSRIFTFSWQHFGREIWTTVLALDGVHIMFLSVWIENLAVLGNLGLDVNHVMPDGRTVIIGFQCDGYAEVWQHRRHVVPHHVARVARQDVDAHSGCLPPRRQRRAHLRLGCAQRAGLILYRRVQAGRPGAGVEQEWSKRNSSWAVSASRAATPCTRLA
jgi:hypothetical protein